MKILRFLSLSLSVLLIMSLFAACADTPNPNENGKESTDSQTTAEAVQSQESTEEQTLYENDNLGDDLNFNDTITILYWEDVENTEFFSEEGNVAELIDNAIFKRNETVSTRLGISFKWVPTKGNFSNLTNFVTKATSDVNNDREYDVFAGYSMSAATLAINGCSENLNSYDNYIDFSKPWWPDSLTSKAMINNRMYFCSGDISTNLLHMMYAVIFNKDMLKDYSNENLYELVHNKQWTLDKMIEICTGVYKDDGNNIVDFNDTFGFMGNNVHYDIFFSGSGLETIENTSDGHLKISDKWGSQKADDLVKKLCNFIYNSGYAYANENESAQAAMKDGRLLFTVNRVQILSNDYNDVSNISFGLLPAPMYDENQGSYITCMAFPYTLYSMSAQSHNKEATAAMLECMGSESYRGVTPVLFETAMKLRYADDQEDAQMYDIIRDAIAIDVGRIFSSSYNGEVYKIYRTSITGNNTSYLTTYNQKVPTITTVTKKINETIDKLS